MTYNSMNDTVTIADRARFAARRAMQEAAEVYAVAPDSEKANALRAYHAAIRANERTKAQYA